MIHTVGIALSEYSSVDVEWVFAYPYVQITEQKPPEHKWREVKQRVDIVEANSYPILFITSLNSTFYKIVKEIQKYIF